MTSEIAEAGKGAHEPSREARQSVTGLPGIYPGRNDMPKYICPEVKCNIGGRPFALRMDINAIELAEEFTGRSFIDHTAWQDMTVKNMAALFFACAVQTDASLSREEVRALGVGHLPDIIDAVGAAYKITHEVPEEEKRPTSGSELSAAVPAV